MTKDEALVRMASLCSRSEHCERQVRQKLSLLGLEGMEADEVVARLREEGYLDDDRYCRAFASDKLRFAHWGRMKIAAALRVAGLPSASIRAAIEALPEDECRRVVADAMRAKARTLAGCDEMTRRRKLMAFAASRGFTVEEAEREVKE